MTLPSEVFWFLVWYYLYPEWNPWHNHNETGGDVGMEHEVPEKYRFDSRLLHLIEA